MQLCMIREKSGLRVVYYSYELMTTMNRHKREQLAPSNEDLGFSVRWSTNVLICCGKLPRQQAKIPSSTAPRIEIY